jgi:hypothetical protein
MDHRDDPEYKRFFELAFAKRPAEELYDMKKDPDQGSNIAFDPGYSQIKSELAARLTAELKATADPRISGERVLFDEYSYRAKYDLNK